MSKGNGKLATSFTRDDMVRRVDAARDCHNRSRDAGSEAVAQTYLLFLETSTGEAKKWLTGEIEKFNDLAEKHNTELKNEQTRAQKFMDGALTKNDHLNVPTDDEEEIKAHAAERARLKIVHERTQAERDALKIFSAKARDDSSDFMPIVRYVFNFNRKVHGSLVSRYCYVLDWVSSQFKGKSPIDVEIIKEAISAAGGFDHVVEVQREIGKTTSEDQKDAEIIRKALMAEAKGIAREVEARGIVDIQAKKTKDGFVLLLGRVSDGGVAVLGEAQASDNDIESAVSNFGKTSLVGDDEASMEFMGRVIEIASVIKEKQEVMGGVDGKQKISTDRIFSLKADEDGSPVLVVSVNHAESGAVFYAKPKVENLLTLDKGPCVLSGSTRRRIEKEMDDAARRRFLTLKVNNKPLTATGKPAESPISWELHNRALAKAQRSTADQTFYWTALSNIVAKPLDIDNFKPQFHSTLAQEELQEIFGQLLKPWKENKDSKKSTRMFNLKLEDQQITVTCGDDDPMELSAKVACTQKISMNFRIPDIHGVFEVLCNYHGSDYQLSGDPGGLLRLSWSDKYGEYGFHFPTVGSDGKLQSRRVAHMRSETELLAAE